MLPQRSLSRSRTPRNYVTVLVRKNTHKERRIPRPAGFYCLFPRLLAINYKMLSFSVYSPLCGTRPRTEKNVS